MGTGKKEANRKARQGKSANGMTNLKVKGENFYRSAKKVKDLNRLKDEGKPQRNADGKIVKVSSPDSPAHGLKNPNAFVRILPYILPNGR